MTLRATLGRPPSYQAFHNIAGRHRFANLGHAFQGVGPVHHAIRRVKGDGSFFSIFGSDRNGIKSAGLFTRSGFVFFTSHTNRGVLHV